MFFSRQSSDKVQRQLSDVQTIRSVNVSQTSLFFLVSMSKLKNPNVATLTWLSSPEVNLIAETMTLKFLIFTEQRERHCISICAGNLLLPYHFHLLHSHLHIIQKLLFFSIITPSLSFLLKTLCFLSEFLFQF